MAFSQAELDALKKAFAAGVLRVAFEGRVVEYGDAGDLLKRIRVIEGEQAAASGPSSRTILTSYGNGLK